MCLLQIKIENLKDVVNELFTVKPTHDLNLICLYLIASVN